MSASQRAVAIVVTVLVVVGAAVLGLSALGVPIGRAPDASTGPTPTIAASSAPSPDGQPSATAAPSTPDQEEIVAVLRDIEAQVIAIRGLEAAEIGDPELITRAELGDELQALFDEEYPPEERERDNRVLRALGLLGPDEDVAELQLELLGQQVLGFYDDTERRMVVVTDAGLDAQAKLSYAHEYTHALQDSTFGLDGLETDAEGQDDRSLARAALIEGDATVTMLSWAFAHLSPEELLEIGSAPIPDTSDIPGWMVNQLQFPYLAGQTWVGALAGNPLEPDYAEVDAAFADPPDSTEQILDPTLEAWVEREAPLDVAVPEFASQLGPGWEAIEETPIGEASIGITLEYLGLDRATAADAADGWGGDRAVIASGPDDAFAVAWRLRWDTTEDADAFAAAYETVLADLPFPAIVRRLAGDEVLVVHGSTDEILRRVTDSTD
jgi:hypothetical protein